MAVVDLADPADAAEFWGELTPEACYLCGKSLTAGPTPAWDGMTGVPIAFHPDCGLDFAARLSRDSLNARFLRDGKNPLAGIAAGLRPKAP